MSINFNILPENFFTKDVFTVAKELLGKYFIKTEENNTLIAKITEIEIYTLDDPASHSFNGKKNRNSVMFNGGGNLYVYFTYGMYFCANIVTGELNEGSAILLRSMEPIEGIETFALRRFNKTEITEKEKLNLLNGPGKIAIGFNITKSLNGHKLQTGSIIIADPLEDPNFEIGLSKRIGITKAIDLERRLYIKNNKYLSRNEKH